VTEEEWLNSADPAAMYDHLGAAVASPRFRWFGLACCRRVEAFLEDAEAVACQKALQFWELYLCGRKSWAAFDAVRNEAQREARVLRLLSTRPTTEAMEAATSVSEPGVAARHAAWAVAASGRAAHEEPTAQADILRDIFGNPFRPVALVRAWLAWEGGTVRRMAEQAYAERAFDRLPILADALEDASCTNADLLGHLRRPGDHVPGCWALDLLRGAS
jgi:hypothetical protein